jgi:type I restriction enzyme M protein
MIAPALVQKLWNYCNILRDDGLSYGDYVKQLTFLLFLKMADKQSRPPFNKPSPIPKGFDWLALLKVDGDDLETLYRHILEEHGKRPGMLSIIFRKAQNKIQDPAKLRRLIVDLIDKEQASASSAEISIDNQNRLVRESLRKRPLAMEPA